MQIEQGVFHGSRLNIKSCSNDISGFLKTPDSPMCLIGLYNHATVKVFKRTSVKKQLMTTYNTEKQYSIYRISTLNSEDPSLL